MELAITFRKLGRADALILSNDAELEMVRIGHMNSCKFLPQDRCMLFKESPPMPLLPEYYEEIQYINKHS